MKIHLAFLCPYNNQGIGGGDRKFGIYYRNLDPLLFEAYMIFVTSDSTKVSRVGHEVILREEDLEIFLEEKNIEFVYLAGAKISEKTEEQIIEKRLGLVNVNFTPLYTTHPNKFNLIISMTDYWKLYWIHQSLSNSHVVYNPIDIGLWESKRATTLGKYRENFKSKKYIVGRMARAEPSKWHYLILATLCELDKRKNYSYGFIFAGMPYLYRKYLSFFLSKEMQDCILQLPEQREYADIAEFYGSIDLFWQTSWIGESFGNVIAEAACFEVPTLTDVKGFYKNNIIRKDLYDAQIELVNHRETGFYGSKPDICIEYLENNTLEQIKELGIHAYEKVRATYDIGSTVKTLAKTLYLIGKSRGIYSFENDFEKIQENPSKKILEDYQFEYGKRIALDEKIGRMPLLREYAYSLLERLWRGIEYIYLAVRKLLKTSGSIDIEKWG